MNTRPVSTRLYNNSIIYSYDGVVCQVNERTAARCPAKLNQTVKALEANWRQVDWKQLLLSDQQTKQSWKKSVPDNTKIELQIVIVSYRLRRVIFTMLFGFWIWVGLDIINENDGNSPNYRGGCEILTRTPTTRTMTNTRT